MARERRYNAGEYKGPYSFEIYPSGYAVPTKVRAEVFGLLAEGLRHKGRALMKQMREKQIKAADDVLEPQ